MVKIIGFHGKANSGKDTAAGFVKELGSTDIFAFAEPLKKACKILFNLSDAQLHDRIEKESIDERWDKSPRQILQWMGTDVLRKYVNQDFFLMNMENRIKQSTAEYILISDVRFDNEAEYIRSLGGSVVKIIRDMQKTGGEPTEHSDHPTEQGISERLIDVHIYNDDSLEKFKNCVFQSLFFLEWPKSSGSKTSLSIASSMDWKQMEGSDNKQILSVEQDDIYETDPATTTLTIKYNDNTIEKINIRGEVEYSKYRKYIKKPYPFHMG